MKTLFAVVQTNQFGVLELGLSGWYFDNIDDANKLKASLNTPENNKDGMCFVVIDLLKGKK